MYIEFIMLGGRGGGGAQLAGDYLKFKLKSTLFC
jgi:hypothetical protein